MPVQRVVVIGISLLLAACSGASRPVTGDAAAGGIATVADAAELCRIELTGAIADSARIGCERAVRRYAELFGEASMPITVRASDGLETASDFEDGRITFRMGNLSEQRRLLASVQGRNDLMDGIVFTAHELGHAQLAGREERLSGKIATDGYGTTLADWFDEAVAIWNEPDGSLGNRLRQARAVIDTMPGLIVYASRRHPRTLPRLRESVHSHVATYGGVRCRVPDCVPPELREPKIVVRSVDAHGGVYVDTLRPGDRFYDSYVQPEFYAPAASLIVFLHDRGGSALIREIARRLGLGMTPTEVFTDLPGMPASPEAVSEQWHRFIRAIPTG